MVVTGLVGENDKSKLNMLKYDTGLVGGGYNTYTNVRDLGILEEFRANPQNLIDAIPKYLSSLKDDTSYSLLRPIRYEVDGDIRFVTISNAYKISNAPNPVILALLVGRDIAISRTNYSKIN